MRPGEGTKVYGSSALTRHSIACPRICDLALRERQLLARGHHDLRLDDVHAGDQLGHRMLHLHAGVHLDEIELAVSYRNSKVPAPR
jgi:hypothetical protein